MNYPKLYIFDFCGTIINKKTHLMIKWYCLFHGHFSFFIKYFSKKNVIDFDISYINKHINIKKLAFFIFRWSTTTNLFFHNKIFLTDNHTTYILTAAMDQVVKEILLLNGVIISNDRLIGSNKNVIITGNLKRKIVERLKNEHPNKEVIFYTDSWDDQPVFNVADKVVFSGILDNKCKSLLNTHNKYSQIT